MSIVFQLFRTFFLLGAFSFGGGVASMELIRVRVVNDNMWLTNSEFTDIISISEMTPGPLGINIASFVGTRIAGIPGTIAATLGYVCPAVIIVMVLAWVYVRFRTLDTVQGVLKGLRPAVVAMILSSAITLTCNAVWGGKENVSAANTNVIAIILTVIFIVLLHKKKIGPVKAIMVSGVVGAIIYAALGVPV